MPCLLRLAGLTLVAAMTAGSPLAASEKAASGSQGAGENLPLTAGLPTAQPTREQPSATSADATPVAPPASSTALPVVGAPAASPLLADELRGHLAASTGAGPRAGEERSALAGFYEARGYAPMWVYSKGLTSRGERVLAGLAEAEDWGLSPAELAVAEAKGLAGRSEPSSSDLAAVEFALSRAVLRYARQARGGRIDPVQLSNALDRKPPLIEPAVVLDGIAGAEAPDAYLRALNPQHAGFQRLREAWLAARKGQGKGDAALQRRLLINMEQWRWMPDDLGSFYIIANVPEFMVRVVRDGKVIHAERMIAGLPDKQTPVFSAEMTTVTFNPQWGVPNSIKVKEILPSLLRGQSVLARHNLRIAQGGREVDATQIDWTKADIRNFHVYQPGGGNNVMGLVKFSFPNKHDVFMHDTPTKNLFNAPSRTFSHGCIRVRDPLKLAHILLEADKGWPMSRITAQAGPGGGQNAAFPLSRRVPVHITYFTAVADEAGKVTTFPDPYGHETRIQMGLDGKAHLIVKTRQDLTAARAEVIARLGEARVTREKADWRRDVFSSN